MNPSLGNKFLQKFQECFSGQMEFAEHVDKCVFMHKCVYISALKLCG